MMHFGKPVIAFRCSYNIATMEGKGGYFESLASLVLEIGRYDQIDGQSLLEIAQRRYTWSIVRRQYQELFPSSAKGLKY
jgi:glycosyltransferase involved in cell wall biosynthesis